MVDFIDKTSEQNGTSLNRENLMAIQGFIGSNIIFNVGVSITETNDKQETLTITPLNIDGISTQTFVGEKTITKTCYFQPNVISEVIG